MTDEILSATEVLRELRNRIKKKNEQAEFYRCNHKLIEQAIKECDDFQSNTAILQKGFVFLTWEYLTKGQNTYATMYTRHILSKVAEAKAPPEEDDE